MSARDATLAAPVALTISEEIERAIRDRSPIIAFETAFLIHALPYPHNVRCVKRCIQHCRARQVAPAFVAMIDGALTVGVSADRLERLCAHANAAAHANAIPRPNAVVHANAIPRSNAAANPDTAAHTDTAARPICAADIAIAMHAGWSGGLTAAATVAIARLTGIAVCVAGGVVGAYPDRTAAHPDRAAAATISADFRALARHPLALVTAGILSPLDIAYSGEQLQALSVSTVGFRCNRLPHYFTADGGYQLPLNVDRADEIARLLYIIVTLNQPHALLIAHPCPPVSALDSDEYAAAQRADNRSDTARNNTNAQSAPRPPSVTRLLQSLFARTADRATTAAIESIVNNCHLATDISVAYAAL